MSDEYTGSDWLPWPDSELQAQEFWKSGMSEKICTGLLAITLHSHDRLMAREAVDRHLRHIDKNVISAAVLCVAHVARIDRVVDSDHIQLLKALQSDESLMPGRVRDAIDDICTYGGIDEAAFES